MSDTKFTPGPWRAVGHEDAWQVVAAGDLGLVAELPMGWNESEGDVRADAHLIAAAPDLYDTLADLLSWNDEPPSASARLRAKNALAKARGEAA